MTKKGLYKTVSQYTNCEPPFRPTPRTRVGSVHAPASHRPTEFTLPPPPLRATDITDQKRLDSLFNRFDTDGPPTRR